MFVNGDDESILINHKYNAHSEFVDMMLNALEEELLTDDTAHEYDEKLLSYLNSYF